MPHADCYQPGGPDRSVCTASTHQPRTGIRTLTCRYWFIPVRILLDALQPFCRFLHGRMTGSCARACPPGWTACFTSLYHKHLPAGSPRSSVIPFTTIIPYLPPRTAVTGSSWFAADLEVEPTDRAYFRMTHIRRPAFMDRDGR